MKSFLKRIYSRLFAFLQRKNAVIGKDCMFGFNSRIINKTGRQDAVIIEDNVMMHGSLIVQGDGVIVLRKFVNIRRNTYIGSVSRVELGRGVIVSDGVTIMDNNNHPVNPELRYEMVQSGWSTAKWSWLHSDSERISVQANAWICQGARIMKGVIIGENSIVAAGAVVTKSVDANTICAGNPARCVKSLNES